MVTVSLLVLVLLVLPAAVAAEKKRANVLFMMADQLRYDASGYAGNPSAITPALDRIAKEGLTMSWVREKLNLYQRCGSPPSCMIRSPQHLSGVCFGGGAADAPFQNF